MSFSKIYADLKRMGLLKFWQNGKCDTCYRIKASDGIDKMVRLSVVDVEDQMLRGDSSSKMKKDNIITSSLEMFFC